MRGKQSPFFANKLKSNEALISASSNYAYLRATLKANFQRGALIFFVDVANKGRSTTSTLKFIDDLNFIWRVLMKVTFHGVRGSITAAGVEFSEYGGHTICTEIMTDAAQIIIDAGSGFQNVALANDRPVVILLSHFHHDHIQGLGFNSGLFSSQSDIFICAALCSQRAAKNHLHHYYSGKYFPIELLSKISNLKVTSFPEMQSLLANNLTLETHGLNHPGGASAYSIATTDAKLCCLLDNEFSDSQMSNLYQFTDDADLAIWDGMFTANELLQHEGWGHSSIEQGEAFLENSNCRRLAISHHAWHRTDAQLNAIQQNLGHSAAFIAKANHTELLTGV